ncbi:ATP-binding protein [Streptomyces sp. AM 2-1-1]|uniref:sensor histidine kinase n=1 Tax=Streptomyces sp. AM 2-1-1 TaxID=3028709 RepID=UPI0023B8C3CA|nr:ATP-binding protein [Streptomyces sp. AM 2-1-1]WEH38519.1 ATP-binding protein [Streptomyces sp. AM 2-1-1]
MSQLRAPDARPDRRESGRHGRPAGRSHSAAARPRAAQARVAPPAPEVRMRPQMLRAALLPTVAALLSGAAAVIFTVRASGVRPSGSLLAALSGSAALAVAAVAAACIGAHRVSSGVLDRTQALRRLSARGHADLQRTLEQLRAGEQLPARRAPHPAPPEADAFDLLGQEITRAQEAAVAAMAQASQLFNSAGNEQKVEVFVNLARRLQSLVHREIQILDELEHEVEDPDLLKGLFHVDHLATRIRRHAENLAVLGGAVSRRQWSNPVTLTEVLRSAIAEVEQYSRVKLVPPIEGTLRGHAVADVIHLVAELVENATVFSAPHTQVLLRVQPVTAGFALEVEDRGLGMPVQEQSRMNALLADPDQVNVAHLLQDGRIGLFVVSALARRHGIAVRLESNIYGGTQAVLVLPQVLLGAESDTTTPPEGVPVPPPGAVHRPPAQDTDPAARPAGAIPQAPPAPVLPGSPDRAPQRAREGLRPVEQVRPHAPHPSPHDQLPPAADRVPPAQGRPPSAGEPTVRPLGTAGTPGGTVSPQPPRQIRREAQGPPLPQRTAERPGTQGSPPAPAVHDVPAAYPDQQPASPARPELPRRTNQENLVPQLRQAPVRRVADEHAVHDPGLVAAFRRGIDLAEARSAQDTEPPVAGSGGHPPTPGPSSAPAPSSGPGASSPDTAQGLPPGAATVPPGVAPYAVPAVQPGRRVAPLPVRAPAAPSERGVPGRPDPRHENTYKE